MRVFDGFLKMISTVTMFLDTQCHSLNGLTHGVCSCNNFKLCSYITLGINRRSVADGDVFASIMKKCRA